MSYCLIHIIAAVITDIISVAFLLYLFQVCRNTLKLWHYGITWLQRTSPALKTSKRG